jgi:nicotinamidase-related amidase
MWTDYTDEWMRRIGAYNTHRLKLRTRKACLLVIDMQNDFLEESGADFFHNAADIVPNVRSIVVACRKARIPVIFTGHRHDNPAVDGGMTAEWWPEIKSGRSLAGGSWGAEVSERIGPQKGERIVWKHRYSAFYNTDLEIVLKGLGVTDIIITGILTNVCCETTARDAFMRDFRVFIVADATASTEPDLHLGSLKNLAYAFASITSTSSLLQKLKTRGQA